MSKNKILTPRVLGFDLIRILCFVAISFHHFNSKLWYIHIFSPFVPDHWYWRTAEIYSRTFSLGGFFILFLTTFLIRFTAQAHEKALKLIPVLLVIWCFSSLADYPDAPYLFTWDIFPLIAVGLGLCWIFFKKVRGASWIVPSLGLIFLAIPFWKWESLNALNLFYQHILIGNCQRDIADWPLLPWVGLIFLGYGLGALVKEKHSIITKFTTKEILGWGLLLLWCPLYWGSYYPIILGDQFACQVQRQEPLAFMAHLLPFMFLMRLSLLEKVQGHLRANKFLVAISNLQINQHFGIAYILHLSLIDLLVFGLKTTIEKSALGSFALLLLILPLTEIFLRLWTLLNHSISPHLRWKFPGG